MIKLNEFEIISKWLNEIEGKLALYVGVYVTYKKEGSGLWSRVYIIYKVTVMCVCMGHGRNEAWHGK